MTRTGCWIAAVASAGAGVLANRLVPSIICGIIALAWLRLAARLRRQAELPWMISAR